MQHRNAAPTKEWLEQLEIDVRADFVTGNLYWAQRLKGRKMGVPIGSKNDRGYMIVKYNGRRERAHRIIWYLFYKEWPMFIIDHKDDCPDNNAITNLHRVTQSYNIRKAYGFGRGREFRIGKDI